MSGLALSRMLLSFISRLNHPRRAAPSRNWALGSARAHLDTTTAWPELMFSLSSPQEERDGERRPLLWNAPLPIPLPTRASRGEGENFWWLCQAAPRAPERLCLRTSHRAVFRAN